MKTIPGFILTATALSAILTANAQTFLHYSTTDTGRWTEGKTVKAQLSPDCEDVVKTNVDTPITTFHRWGTTFNEQDWKALGMLNRDQQDEILSRAFSPDGELEF